MLNTLIERLSKPVPRYTSYPTALHFDAAVDAATYADWLAGMATGTDLSLYVHIPFCQSLCWYCGCNTKATRRYEPVASYLETLKAEAAGVAARLPRSHQVTSIHWGGGSPNILSGDDIEVLTDSLRRDFVIAEAAELAIEIDPRWFSTEQALSLRRSGFTRASIGVQDLDPAVQSAIGRNQSFDQTRRAADLCRDAGIGSINVDLIYGLPYQTTTRVAETVTAVLQLSPDRLAVFGYAHMPQRFRHQGLIRGDLLPGAVDRFAQAAEIARVLTAAGYVRIGIDHYVRPGDPLALGSARRNFQGYTSDTATALIGLGASAIGKLQQGYVQNATATADYQRRIAADGLAVVRGRALTTDDRVRSHVIERLMCDLVFDQDDLADQFGVAAEAVIAEAIEVAAADRDGLIEPTATGFRIAEQARPFARTVCAAFDAYLDRGTGRYSAGI